MKFIRSFAHWRQFAFKFAKIRDLDSVNLSQQLLKFAFKISKIIHGSQPHKIYYVKAPAMAMAEATENPLLRQGFGGQVKLKTENKIALGLIGFLIIAPIINQLLHSHLLLKGQSHAEVYDLKLYPAPSNSNYLYQNTVNGFKIYLGNRIQENKPNVRFEEGSSSVEFVPDFDQPLNKNTQLLANDQSLVYKNVLPGIDLKYSLNGKGIKEEIIINDQGAFAHSQSFADGSLKFALNLQNAVPKKSLEGETQAYFIEPINEEYRFHIPKPYMIDAAGNRSEAIELKINQLSSLNNNGGQSVYAIIIAPDPQWLASAVYPVTIDPSIVHDESSEFTGTTNRIDDEGSGTAPKLRTPYHELPADIHTVGLWHINETVNDSCSGGQDACDSSGNGYHGTAIGTTIETTNQKLGAAARSFNGSSDYIEIPHSADLSFTSSQSFTLSAWVYVPSLPSAWKGVVTKSRDSSPWYGIWISSDNQWTFGGGAANITGSSVTLGWHHVSIIQNGGADRIIYVDGINTGSGVASNLNGTGALWIGGSKSVSEYFNGVIDEVRISNIARSPEEIKQDAQRFPYGVYSSDTIDLTSGNGTVASAKLEWTDNVSTPGAMLSGYSNFKPVIIDNTQNSSTLTNYQTKVKVDYDSNMQTDFDDLRFTSSNKTSSFGSEYTFNTGTTSYVSTTPLDSTHFVVAYRNVGGDNYGHAKIGTVSGTTISYGNEYTFNSASTEYIFVAALDSTHFVVGYRDAGGDTYGHAKIGTVSDTTISYGSVSTFNSAVTWYISISALDSTHFVVGYQDYGGDTYGHAKIGTVSDTTISYGSEYTFNSAVTKYVSVAALDSTHFVAGYRDDGGDTYGHAKIGTVSDTTISYGSVSTFNSASTEYYIPVAALDSTHFVVGYMNCGGNPYYGCAKVGSVSGSTIAYGNEATFNPGTTNEFSMAALDSTHFVVGYTRYNGANFIGYTKTGTVSGSVISCGSESTFSSNDNSWVSMTALDSTHFVVGYRTTNGLSKVGTAEINNLDYWIETKSDGVEATVWVEVDTIPASSLTTIWMWYGNGGASAGSNIDNTMLFGDDFPGSSLDGTKWTSSGTVSVSGGELSVSGNSYVIANTAYGTNRILEGRSKSSVTNANLLLWSVGTSFGSSDADDIFAVTDTSSIGSRTYVGASYTETLWSGEVGVTPYHKYKTERISTTSVRFYQDNTLFATHTTNIPTSNLKPVLRVWNASGTLNADWVFVRQYASPEPITGVGADIEFQTRTGSTSSPPDGWEAWKPTTNETQILSMDSDATNWTASTENLPAIFYGSEATFNSASSTYVSTTSLDSTHFVVAYRDSGGDTYGHAKVGTISGTTISYGSESDFNAANTEYISVTALDSTHFAVAYKDTGGDTYGHAKVGTISGTTISYGSESDFNAAATDYISVAALDSTHFAVAYRDAGGEIYGYAKIGTVSSTISYGSEATFNANDTYYISVDALDSTHFVVGFQLDGSNYGQAKIGAVSGSTITFGDVSTFNAASTFEISVAALDATHFVVGYGYSILNGRARIGTVSDTTISYGSEYTFLSESSLDSNSLSVATLDTNHFVVGYKNLYGTTYGRANIGTVSGTTISFSSKYTFNMESSLNISVTALDADYFVVAYRDSGGGDTYNHAKVGKLIPQNLSIDNESAIKMEGNGSLIATVGAQLVDANTSALWHLEETSGTGAYIQDETANNNDGTPTGTTVVDGFYGKARSFNTNADYINTTLNGLPSSTGTITIDFWAKIDSTGPSQTTFLVALTDDSANRLNIHFPWSDGNIYWDFGNISTTGRLSTSFSSSWYNQWAHWAFVSEAGVGQKIYRNGVIIANDGDASTFTKGTKTLRIGQVDSTYWWKGQLDEVKISSTARTSEEIAEAYRAGRDHRLQKTISSTDLSGKTKVPFYFAADKQGTIAETYIGETDHAVYGSDSNTQGLWHLDDLGNWWNPSWERKKAISVLNNTASALTNFQVNFTVSYDSDMQTDFDDLRFTNSVGGELHYWIESKTDSSSANVWVEIDSLPASSTITIYMYYGNIGASAGSNCDNTFDFCDEFPGSSLNSTKWPNTSESPVVSGGSVVLDSTSSVETIRNNTTFSRPYIIEFRYRQSDITNYHRAGFSNSSAGTSFSADDAAYKFGHYDTSTYANHNLRNRNEAAGPSTNNVGTENTNWHDWKIIWTSSDVKFYDDDALLGTHTTGIPDEAMYVRLEEEYSAYAGGSFYVDWTFVRKYASSDPTITQKGEESKNPTKDSSANGNDGGVNGAIFTQGKIGGARYFNGSTDYIQIPNSTSLNINGSGSKATIDFWFFPSTLTPTWQCLIYKNSGGSDCSETNCSDRQYILFLNTSGYIHLASTSVNNIGVTQTSLDGPSGYIKVGEWYHVVGVIDSPNSIMRIYINGQDVASTAYSNTGIRSGNGNVFIGGNGVGSFNGIIDEVRISNTARTADEIRLAYQYGLRTHQITSDFVTTAGSDGPTSTSDLQFTPDTTTNLYKGDTVIVRENYNGTAYIMQGEVSSISSGLVTVASWSGTAPSGGYSTNADVFKWQREYWDLKDISPADRNATVRLGLRILDASEGFTMYLDDFRNNTNYLTDNQGSTVNSTLNRYIQYRAVLSTNNTAVTPELTSVTLDYNRYPTAPTSLLTNGLINPGNVTDTTPYFSAIYNDPDENDVANKYRIQVDDNSDFGSTVWDSGSSGTAMTNCTEGSRCEDITYGGASTDLQWGTRYYWRIKYWDDQAAEGDWSTSGDYFVMATIERPKVCVIDDGSQPSELTVKWQDDTTLETGYRIEKKTDSEDFTLLATDPANTTSRLDNTTSAEHDYQYRIRANSDNGNSEWCTTAPVDFSTGSFRFEGVQLEGVKIE